MSVTENIVDADQYKIATEPYYEPVGNELSLFESAYDVRMPMMIKGPTGCGKSRTPIQVGLFFLTRTTRIPAWSGC